MKVYIHIIVLFIVLAALLVVATTTSFAHSIYHPKPTSTSAPLTPVPATENKPFAATLTNDITDNETWHTVQVFNGEGNVVTPPFQVSGSKWCLSWDIEHKPSPDASLVVHVFRQNQPYALWKTVTVTSDSKGKMIFPVMTDNDEFFLKVFGYNLKSWTIIVQDNSPAVPCPAVEISYIHYKGTRYPRDTENCICYEVVEPDEYVVIINSGEAAQKMGGWTLKNISKGYPTFTFPADFILHPGQAVLVTTNKVYPDCEAWLEFGTKSPYCTKQLWFSFYFGPGDIWDNRVSNTAVLYDSDGREVSRKSYTVVGD